MWWMFEDEVDRSDPRAAGAESSTMGPGGIRYPAWLIATILVGITVAPIGAGMSAIIAYASGGWNQKRWRGGFIILAAILLVTTLFELYLLSPGEEPVGPPGGDGVQG